MGALISWHASCRGRRPRHNLPLESVCLHQARLIVSDGDQSDVAGAVEPEIEPLLGRIAGEQIGSAAHVIRTQPGSELQGRRAGTAQLVASRDDLFRALIVVEISLAQVIQISTAVQAHHLPERLGRDRSVSGASPRSERARQDYTGGTYQSQDC